MKKFLILFVLSLIFFASLSSIVLASNRPLEVAYPAVPEVTAPTTTQTPLPNYIKYIFNFFIWASGFIALIVLVIGGTRYVISAGNSERMRDAKNQIFAALAGLALLLSSWLILTAINPQLKNLSINKLPVVPSAFLPGVYLCTQRVDGEMSQILNTMRQIRNLSASDPQRSQLAQQLKDSNWFKTIGEKCWWVPNSVGELDKKVNDLAIAAYTVPSETGTIYGAVIYNESKYQGTAQVVYTLTPELGIFDIPPAQMKPSSIRTFTLKQPRPESSVILYELIDFNKADPEAESEEYSVSNLAEAHYIRDLERVGSVKIEGQLLVIFFKQEYSDSRGWPPDAILDVVIQTDANLYDNIMGRWCEKIFSGEWTLEGWQGYYPCPKQMAIVSGGVY